MMTIFAFIVFFCFFIQSIISQTKKVAQNKEQIA